MGLLTVVALGAFSATAHLRTGLKRVEDTSAVQNQHNFLSQALLSPVQCTQMVGERPLTFPVGAPPASHTLVRYCSAQGSDEVESCIGVPPSGDFSQRFFQSMQAPSSPRLREVSLDELRSFGSSLQYTGMLRLRFDRSSLQNVPLVREIPLVLSSTDLGGGMLRIVGCALVSVPISSPAPTPGPESVCISQGGQWISSLRDRTGIEVQAGTCVQPVSVVSQNYQATAGIFGQIDLRAPGIYTDGTLGASEALLGSSIVRSSLQVGADSTSGWRLTAGNISRNGPPLECGAGQFLRGFSSSGMVCGIPATGGGSGAPGPPGPPGPTISTSCPPGQFVTAIHGTSVTCGSAPSGGGGQASFTFTLVDPNAVWKCRQVDLRPYCAGPGGCRVIFSTIVRDDPQDRGGSLQETLMFEQSDISRNNHGTTFVSVGWETAHLWILTGPGSQPSLLTAPYDRVYVYNYLPNFCPGGPSVPSSFANPYLFTFAGAPSAHARIKIISND